MKIQWDNAWGNQLKTEIQKPYFQDLMSFVDTAYEENRCYPPKELIFSAFDYCSFENLKVVLIGQDPYHGLGQANGLSFSVNDGVTFPPSLRNIFKELENDLEIPIAISGNLERWAKQGVLMLNATLTVQEGKAGSHQKKGWETFTDAIIQKISDEKEDVIFLLWGNYAKKKGAKINREKHYVLESGHPSPMSANQGFWFGNKHFSQVNSRLKKLGKSEIEW
ncbi:uracil-DNA glycosylase [Flavobacterium sp. '19STA2R22 D10 B1']|uniref:uracil-DNA glycosylase n=1 Tax=Flavobacterium aerium TaxID=3037261 RepID=UPI00278BCBCE|nr:uracil-DNA glycosylase [Flavobacterium sp. '19STA2R22 D10 B1']